MLLGELPGRADSGLLAREALLLLPLVEACVLAEAGPPGVRAAQGTGAPSVGGR